MEKGSVIDAEQTRLEFDPQAMTAMTDGGMLMLYWDYMQTREYAELNRKIDHALKSLHRHKPIFFVPYRR